MTKPTVFVGSSGEGLDIARGVQSILEDVALVSLWNKGVFGLTEGTLEGLVHALDRFDFAILVITPDDVVISREVQAQAARDNVMFELGLFLGRLGPSRTYAICSDHQNLKLPSDLAGVTVARYRAADASRDLLAALGPACNRIRAEIRSHGRLAKATPSPESCGITILSPKPNQKVPNGLEATGLYENLPPGFKLWVFTIFVVDEGERYWPQQVAQIQEDGAWRSNVWGLGGNPGDRRKFGAFIVGESGQALIQYFKTAGKEYTAQGAKRWLGITRLTPDIVECATVEVVLGE